MEWMTPAQRAEFASVCVLIDSIEYAEDFYRVMNEVNRYSVDIVNAAREFKKCYNSAQYPPRPRHSREEDDLIGIEFSYASLKGLNI